MSHTKRFCRTAPTTHPLCSTVIIASTAISGLTFWSSAVRQASTASSLRSTDSADQSVPVILLGCLYSGITTPTEAAATAALYALLASVLIYRSIGWGDF